MLSLGGEDYNVTVHDIIFAAGEISMPFYVQIKNDDVSENPEEFTLNFDALPALHSRRVSVTTSNLKQTKVIIMDNNGEYTVVYMNDKTVNSNLFTLMAYCR